MTSDEIARLERPSQSLLTLYVLRAVLTGPAVLITLPVLLCRYWTLRYRFDEDGIHARWGVLFRREVNLSYARIQDLHLTSGLLQRWLGLADVQVQTASGSATPELVIEGFKNHEAIRDFLYTRMRGYRRPGPPATDRAAGPGLSRPDRVAPTSPAMAADGAGALEEGVAASLREVAAELRATRAALERLGAGRPSPTLPPP
jgi:membrane protein YdbS with pleckstrin-like domain